MKNLVYEAVIGIGTKGVTSDVVDRFCDNGEIKALYPKSSPIYMGILELNPQISATSNIIGRQLTSDDKKENLFVDDHRITLSDRSEYKNFETIKEKFFKIYNLFSKHVLNYSLTNIALRYNNHFTLTPEQRNYFLVKSTFEMSDISDVEQKFLSIASVYSKKHEAEANLTVQIEKNNENFNIIFDIDCSKSLKEIGDTNIDILGLYIDRLKDFRTELFKKNFDQAFIEGEEDGINFG